MTQVRMTREQRAFYQAIGDRLRTARANRGLSQRQLGQRIGVTATAISYWEAGIHQPTLWRIRQLERVLGEQVA